MYLWDQSQYSLFMWGTGPSLNCWHLGLVPERHFLCLGPDKYCIYLVPEIKNVSLGPVPDINNGDWDQSQRAILNVWDQIITNLNTKFIWSQISEKALWDQSQHSLLMCGTSPSLNCWHLGLVPERHFLCLGPDNDPHYLVPNIKNVSMGPVPDINNGDWDWSQRAVFGIWDWSQSIIGTTNYILNPCKYLLEGSVADWKIFGSEQI